MPVLQATVDISSKYKGIVSKVYYKTNDVAHVGKPLVDIRTEGEGKLLTLDHLKVVNTMACENRR